MSQFVVTQTKAFACNGAIGQYLRVKMSGTGVQIALAGVSDKSIGTLEEASFASGDFRAVRLRSADGTRKMVANGAISVGADVFAAASGKISATRNGFPEGIALEAAAADGDIIEVLNVGGGGGLKVALGQQTTVAASDTVVTGLNTVLAVVASFEDDIGDDPEWVTAQIGNQAGAPAAGSIIIKTWKNTGGTDPTPVAATTFTKKVNWIAVGV
jgi:hypothetical protein